MNKKEKRKGEEKCKLMRGFSSKKGGRREMSTYERIFEQKGRKKRNVNF